MRECAVKSILGVAVLSAVFVCGCMSGDSRTAGKPAIISSLESTHRDTVAMTLSVLDKNGIAIPEIEFGNPYSEAKPKLEELVRALSRLPEARLRELDESLKRSRELYSPIYSPAWSSGADGWTQKKTP